MQCQANGCSNEVSTLSGRARRYCSPRCAKRAYRDRHGVSRTAKQGVRQAQREALLARISELEVRFKKEAELALVAGNWYARFAREEHEDEFDHWLDHYYDNRGSSALFGGDRIAAAEYRVSRKKLAAAVGEPVAHHETGPPE